MSVQLSLSDIALDLGADPARLGSALDSFLGTLDRPPALLGLGEPTHGIEDFPLLRNEVLAHLVRRHGFRAIALESDCVAATLVDDYVTGGAGHLDRVLRDGFSHEFGTSPANRELVSWLREYNSHRDPDEYVRFHGFDAPLEMAAASSPRATLLAAHAYLARFLPEADLPHTAATLDSLLGDDAEWSDPAAMLDPARSIGDTDRARALRLAADDLLARFDTERPVLQGDSRIAFERALLHARAAHGLLRYHAAMASSVPHRFEILCKLRDAMMAANLLAITAASTGPCLVFAHNSHLQRHRSSMWMGGRTLRWWSAGALAAADLGDAYTCVATDIDTCAYIEAPREDPDSLQSVLAAATETRALFPARELAAALDDRIHARTDTDYRYAPLGIEALHGFDAIAFLTTSPDALVR